MLCCSRICGNPCTRKSSDNTRIDIPMLFWSVLLHRRPSNLIPNGHQGSPRPTIEPSQSLIISILFATFYQFQNNRKPYLWSGRLWWSWYGTCRCLRSSSGTINRCMHSSVCLRGNNRWVWLKRSNTPVENTLRPFLAVITIADGGGRGGLVFPLSSGPFWPSWAINKAPRALSRNTGLMLADSSRKLPQFMLNCTSNSQICSGYTNLHQRGNQCNGFLLGGGI